MGPGCLLDGSNQYSTPLPGGVIAAGMQSADSFQCHTAMYNRVGLKPQTTAAQHACNNGLRGLLALSGSASIVYFTKCRKAMLLLSRNRAHSRSEPMGRPSVSTMINSRVLLSGVSLEQGRPDRTVQYTMSIIEGGLYSRLVVIRSIVTAHRLFHPPPAFIRLPRTSPHIVDAP